MSPAVIVVDLDHNSITLDDEVPIPALPHRQESKLRKGLRRYEQDSLLLLFFLIHRFHSISFTRAQGIPEHKIGFGRGKGWESWGEIG